MVFYTNTPLFSTFFLFARQAHSLDPSFSSNVQVIKFNTEDAKDAQRTQRGRFEWPRHCLLYSEKTRLAVLFVYPFALRHCVKGFNTEDSKGAQRTRREMVFYTNTPPLLTLFPVCEENYPDSALALHHPQGHSIHFQQVNAGI
jgi:hypothetical protein